MADRPPQPTVLFYLISLFVPLAGFIIAAIYLGKPEPECRDFGRNCLIIALIPVILAACCWCNIFGVGMMGMFGGHR